MCLWDRITWRSEAKSDLSASVDVSSEYRQDVRVGIELRDSWGSLRDKWAREGRRRIEILPCQNNRDRAVATDDFSFRVCSPVQESGALTEQMLEIGFSKYTLYKYDSFGGYKWRHEVKREPRYPSLWQLLSTTLTLCVCVCVCVFHSPSRTIHFTHPIWGNVEPSAWLKKRFRLIRLSHKHITGDMLWGEYVYSRCVRECVSHIV